ncbi:MAG: PDZ domain-containing protein [Rhodopirellula sp. JB055]|uniref:PDZ domain-containing protein n=1 Tax=Rhodopirellula sp. JB055 TaxID=3342846 RepID=UPI00370A0EDE
MLRSRRRSNWIRWAVCLSIVSCTHAINAPDASAQRLLERLRNRIQSPPPSPLAQPRYQNPAAASRGTASRNRTLATPVPRRNSSTVRRTPSTQRSTSAANATNNRAGEIASDEIQFGMRVSPAVVGGYEGLRVDGFSSESRADEAGVRPGDLIVAIGNSRTRTLDDAVSALEDVPSSPGQEPAVSMQLFRGGRLYRGNVPAIASPRVAAKPPLTLPGSDRSVLDDPNRDSSSTNELPTPQLPPPASQQLSPPSNHGAPTLARSRGSLGIEVRDATPQRGVLVVTVPDNTAGKAAGLAVGDRIVSASGRLVRGTDDLLREIAILQPGDEIEFGLVRGDDLLQKQIEMGGPGGVPTRSAIANSKPDAASADAQAAETNAANSGGFLGGMGSVFGKMLGGDASNPPPASEELPAPAAEPKASFTLPAPTAEVDPLALPDDSAAAIAEPLPPATPAPMAEPDALPAQTKSPTVEELKREIERLKQQLQAKE